MASLKKIVKVTAPLAVGVLLLWLLYRKMDFRSLHRTLSEDAEWGILLFASAFGTLGNFFRGWRWSLLLEPLNKAPKLFGNSCLTVQGNYAVNMLLPRLGEIWRCTTMKGYTGIPFSKILGTVFVDRGMDLVVAAFLAALAAMINLPFFVNFFTQNPEFLNKLEALMANPLFWVASAVGFILLGFIVYWFYFKPKRGITEGKGKVRSSFDNLWEGLKTVFTMEKKWAFLLHTALIWVSYFLQFYLTFYAFDFMSGLGWQEALLTFVLITFAVAAPVQGGIGAWHFMVIFSLVFFGVNRTDASSFALIVHTLQTLWTTLVGILCIGLLPLFNREKRIQA